MVLDHVAQSAGFLVITAALAHAQLFADRDLHVVDRVPVPQAFENRVRKAKHQNVLHRFFAQVMVDAKDLLLAGVVGQLIVQLPRGFQIVAERLLDDDAFPAFLAGCVQQSCAMHLFDHLAELAGQSGEIKKKIAAKGFAAEGAELFLQFRVACCVGQVALAIKEVLGKFPPDLVICQEPGHVGRGPSRQLRAFADSLSERLSSQVFQASTLESRGRFALPVRIQTTLP